METLQTVKEQAAARNYGEINNAEIRLPRLPVTDADRDAYLKCVVNGEAFRHEFKNEKLGVNIVLRDKTKRETDIISRAMDKLYNDGKILSVVEYTNTFNVACLYYQLEEFNGVVQNRAYPASVWDMKDFDLLAEIDKSPIGNVSSSVLFVLMAMMSQFNQKLYRLAMEAVDPDFTDPAKGS